RDSSVTGVQTCALPIYSILITGGAGYLGSMLTPQLLAAGHKVTILDNFMHRQTPVNQLCADPNFDVVKGDSRDEATLKPLVAKRSEEHTSELQSHLNLV